MRSPRVAQKSPARKDARPAAKTRGRGPTRAELALAMADALNDILRYEARMQVRR